MDTNLDVVAVLDAGVQLGGQAPKDPASRSGFEVFPYVVVPRGAELKSLAGQYVRELPRRRTGLVALGDAASFCRYVTAFKLTETLVFADPDTNVLTAIFDYHEAGPSGAPRWGGHRATLTLRHTTAWTNWTQTDGKKVSQLEFAEFIENNLMDIADPDGATILQISRSLEATKTVGFASGLRLSSGETQLTYTEKIDATSGVDTKRMTIPERFVIGVVPFDGGTEKYRVEARLRYRIGGGGALTLGVDLLRPDLVEDDAFNQTLQAIKTAIGVDILVGAAPAPIG